MSFEDRVLELNELFFQLYQSRLFQEKKSCTDSPLSRFTNNDIRVLELVERRRELTMKDLSETLSLPMSTLTGIADKLVRKKYIERIRIDEDRRVVLVKITSLGRETISLRKNAHCSVSEQLLKSLTDEEQKEFLRLFRKAAG